MSGIFERPPEDAHALRYARLAAGRYLAGCRCGWRDNTERTGSSAMMAHLHHRTVAKGLPVIVAKEVTG